MSNEHEALPEGMVPWNGGDSAPEAWDGGDTLLRDGSEGRGIRWCHKGWSDDIIAYTPKRATPSPSTNTLERREAVYVTVPLAFYEWLGTIERDTRVHDLTPHEQSALCAALTPSPRVDEGRNDEDARRDMLNTARELREHANGDCNAIKQALHWERMAATTPADPGVGKIGESVADAVHEELWKADDRVAKLEADLAEAVKALRVALDHYDRNVCHHDDTHRGGFLWTICDQCGAKWADDEGGFKPFEYPAEIDGAFATLNRLSGEG